jgi:hypothetical protein
MCQNIFFPQHLVRYLETIDLKDMAGDALILLINLFDDRCVETASPALVQKLIDAIPFLTTEETADAVISMLVCCFPHMDKGSAVNVIRAEFTNIEREDFYKKKLMGIANSGSSSFYRMDKVMQTAALLLKSDYFNMNDLELLTDICC